MERLSEAIFVDACSGFQVETNTGTSTEKTEEVEVGALDSCNSNALCGGQKQFVSLACVAVTLPCECLRSDESSDDLTASRISGRF